MGFKIWMVVDAIQRRAGTLWLMVIFFLPLGEFVYFVMVRHKLGPPKPIGRAGHHPEARSPPPPDVATLRFQLRETPSIHNQVALAQGLHDAGEFDEAAALFQAVLDQRPRERACRYGLARCLRVRKQHGAAIAQLQGLIAQDPSYLDHAPWHDLADAQLASGAPGDAEATLRELVRISPRLEHKLGLAQLLAAQDQLDEARTLLTDALEAQSVAPAHIQRNGRAAAAAAQALLGELT